MKTTDVLIIDDEINLTRSLSFTLRKAGFVCHEAHNGHNGLAIIQKQCPDIVLLDVRMPGIGGLDTLKAITKDAPFLPVIMMSAFDDTQDAVTAIKLGAADYIAKPFDVDELILMINEITARQRLASEVAYLRQKDSLRHDFIGISPVIRTLRDNLERVATSQVKNVLLRGETGTGKAVAARDLHARSGVEAAPFIEVNCATLAESDACAALFGTDLGTLHKGKVRRRGLIEIADGGSLFLDEISELPLDVQGKLLTFIETRRYRPVGLEREKQADVCIISATNVDLEQAVADKTFRQDLFFRLNVMSVQVPPLRSRQSDVDLLTDHFARVLSEQGGMTSIGFSKPVRKILNAYSWPGNVRELKNLIERLTILHSGTIITENQLPIELHAAVPGASTTHIDDRMTHMERALIREALIHSQGRKGVAAVHLGISRHALKRRMNKLDMS